jgi:hypothetical protein
MLQDTLVILGMLALRLGVPIALTAGICYVLNRAQASREAELSGQRAAHLRACAKEGKVVRQLHCWEIKRCDPETRPSCPAYHRQNLPCWLALQLAGHALGDECLRCGLYDLRKAA